MLKMSYLVQGAPSPQLPVLDVFRWAQICESSPPASLALFGSDATINRTAGTDKPLMSELLLPVMLRQQFQPLVHLAISSATAFPILTFRYANFCQSVFSSSQS
ncbi:hypothetical protein EYF80_008838 [Liparis tanakae]|uniref:Uncharacterized protein n=1 Tax=Liparis tanakae TaxID=230148 RepID=A0A4Z2IUD8_9TELE|nr:hypothetical protein EYF80_008838 [Liparis tanakae]